MAEPSWPYGFPTSWAPRSWPRCVNAQRGTFGHECGKPASWIASKDYENGFQACFCDDCSKWGHEAGSYRRWRYIGLPAAPRVSYELTPEGEQAVIPGCERNRAPGKRQLDLF